MIFPSSANLLQIGPYRHYSFESMVLQKTPWTCFSSRVRSLVAVETEEASGPAGGRFGRPERGVGGERRGRSLPRHTRGQGRGRPGQRLGHRSSSSHGGCSSREEPRRRAKLPGSGGVGQKRSWERKAVGLAAIAEEAWRRRSAGGRHGSGHGERRWQGGERPWRCSASALRHRRGERASVPEGARARDYGGAGARQWQGT